MYQLSIDHRGRSVTISDHPSRDHAHRSLLDYVIGADYYLRPLATAGAEATRYELLQLAEADTTAHRPTSAGHATIAPMPAEGTSAGDAPSPYRAAAEAQRWIAHHQVTWDHGSDTDPGTRYPLAVLTAAQAEGRCWFSAGALWREAVHLSGVDPVDQPDQHLLEALRRNVLAAEPGACPTAAELAAAVQTALPESITAAHTCALIWWYALLNWGKNAS
jgi:hypothetical protein